MLTLQPAETFDVEDFELPEGTWREVLVRQSILILGSPRSGTSWLAKIVDSHPDILYRHEPDEAVQLRAHPAEQLLAWAQQGGLRVVAKRPWFRKSWRPWPVELLWRTAASGLALAERLPLARVTSVPDLILPSCRRRLRLAMKIVNWDGTGAAAALPETRVLLILRHPCGQVASVMAGRRTGQFTAPLAEDGGMIAARNYAARFGVDGAAFDKAPDYAQYAWVWRAFNEPIVDALGRLPNARVVVYDDLCRNPNGLSRELFSFLNLSWQPQTQSFLDTSTSHDGPSGFYDVFRSGPLTSERWRQTMTPEAQQTVREIVRAGTLGSYWPDTSRGAERRLPTAASIPANQ
jgi:hypothetical protein